MAPPALSPLRHRPFRRLAASYGVGALGDWAGEIALSIAVLSATGRAEAVVGFWMLHRWAPGLLTPFLTRRLTHVAPHRLLATLATGQAALWAGLAFAVHRDALALGVVLVLLDGTIAPVSRAVARTAVVAVTRPLGLHREGNAVLNFLFTGTAATGPAIGGALAAVAGVVPTLLANSASFVAVAILLAPTELPVPTSAVPDRGRPASRRRLPRDVRVLLVAGGVVMALIASVLPIEVVFVTGALHGNEADFGLVLTSWGSGMVVGAALVARLPRVPIPALLAAGTAGAAISYLGMGAAGAVAIVVAFSMIGGIGNGASGMAFVTHLQERAGDPLLARANALYETIATVCPGAGFVLGGLVSALAGPRPVYLLAGAGMLLVLAALIPAPKWRSRAVSRPAPAPSAP